MRSQHGGHVKRVGLAAQLVRFDIDRQMIVLDCVVASERPLTVADQELETGEPFSVIVRIPSRGWLKGGLAALQEWADDCRPLDVRLSVGVLGARASLGDGGTVLNFDLIAVMGGIRTVQAEDEDAEPF